MKISSRLAISIHILLFINKFYGQFKITSDFLAKSVNVNPVIIRQILVDLNHSGITKIEDRKKGEKIIKPLQAITMFDIYKAVDCVENDLFAFHKEPNVNCPVGKNIHAVLDNRFETMQTNFENNLKAITMEDIVKDFKKIEGLGEINS